MSLFFPHQVRTDHPRVTQVLTLGFTLLVLLLVAMLGIGLYATKENLRIARDEVFPHTYKAVYTYTMLEAIRDRMAILTAIVNERDSGQLEQLVHNYHEQAHRFGEARRALMAMPLEDHEKGVLERQKVYIGQAVDIQNKVVDLVYFQGYEEALELLAGEGNTSQQRVVATLTDLLNYQTKESVEFISRSQTNSRIISNILLISGTIAIFLAIAVAFYVVRRITRLFLRLQAVSRDQQQTLHDLEFEKLALDEHAIVSITDVDGRITYANQKFQEISGYPLEDLLGNTHRIINSGLHPREFFRDMWQTITSKKIWHGIICNRDRDGGEYWVNTTIVPYIDANGEIARYLSIRTDVTPVQLAYQKLEETNIKLLQVMQGLEQAYEVKSQLISNLNHELRTPLNSIMGGASMLEESGLNAEQKEYLGFVLEGGYRMKAMVEELLDFSSIDSTSAFDATEAFVLTHAIEILVQAEERHAGTKRITLETHIDNDLPAQLTGNKQAFDSIFSRILNNAIKFSQDGNVRIHVSLDHMNMNSLWIKFKIADDGIGIPENMKDRIFSPFAQVDGSFTRNYEGAGLGLTIAKGLVEKLSGSIGMESEQGKGSLFWFILPFSK
jgi:PAS domain S-box-containing protein